MLEIPDRTKCFLCGRVFGEHEIRWASPIMETLCDSCHTEYLSPTLNEEDRQMRKHPLNFVEAYT